MTMFDDYAFAMINAAWKNGRGGLTLLHAGCEDFRVRPYYRRYLRRFAYIPHCVFGGRGTLLFRGKTYDIEAGQMFLLPPGEQVLYAPDPEDPWRYCWFDFSGEQAQDYASLLGYSTPDAPVRSMRDPAGTEALFRHHMDESQMLSVRARKSTVFSMKQLAVFFTFLATEAIMAPENFVKESTHKGTAEDLERHIRTHFRDPKFSLSEEVLPLKITASLRKEFYDEHDMTPVGYLSSLRLRYAAELLATGDKTLSITEISVLSGFRDPLYFMRMFKKHYGLTATDYRNDTNHN